jgi:hypothetical protein
VTAEGKVDCVTVEAVVRVMIPRACATAAIMARGSDAYPGCDHFLELYTNLSGTGLFETDTYPEMFDLSSIAIPTFAKTGNGTDKTI